MTRFRRLIDSPVGPILLSADASGRITGAEFSDRADEPNASGSAIDDRVGPRVLDDRVGPRVLDDAAAQFAQYFEGRRRCFDVPLALTGSPFQVHVWTQLQQIPYGTTVSYGQLATQLGRPGAARAVGHANARNPIAVIVPCHRVVGSSNQLTGYGGGLSAKRHLLDLEARGGAR